MAIEKPTSIRREIAKRGQKDFKLFIREAWKVIEPATPLSWNWHIDCIAEHLAAVSSGEITRLVVNIAPGHMKSTLFSVMWPAWDWTNAPHERWLCASHSLGLAIRDNRNCRSLIESEWYQACYGDIFHLSSDQNAKSFFENNYRGYRMAVSVGSKGIGKRGTRLLIDDPNDSRASEADIEATTHWFGQTWLSRLNDQEHGAMVVVGQRLHEEDLSGYILNNLKGWEHLNLPTEYEPHRKCVTNIKWNEKSVWKGCDPRTEEGELLWEEKFPPVVLSALKEGLGPMGYAAQHQQSPVPSGGGQFRREWFRYFEETPEAYILHRPEGNRSIFKSQLWEFGTVDLAISSKQTADYTVFAIWAVTPERDLLLIDVIRARLSNPDQLKTLRTLRLRYPGAYFKIEKVGYQLALIQQALAEGIVCREYQPVRDKVSRASTASIWMENGKYYFRKNAPWLNDVESELLMFPMGAHDDIVDNFSMSADEVTVTQEMRHLDDETAQALSGYVGY
jgi:predicted phage terminase large subunit-like protein